MQIITEILENVRFDAQGLVPAIAQQYDSRDVLMLAWMSPEALRLTLESGQVCYWSRSRRGLWRKGETSGQIQTLVRMHVDCDKDALLLEVDQKGVACHTGRTSCFFHTVGPDGLKVTQEVLVDPAELYRQ